jgi:hypothetical protein
MNLRVPLYAGKFLSSCTIDSFSRRARLREWVSEWVSEKLEYQNCTSYSCIWKSNFSYIRWKTKDWGCLRTNRHECFGATEANIEGKTTYMGPTYEHFTPYGFGLEYLHRIPERCRMRWKGNSLPGSITGPPCHWGT